MEIQDCGIRGRLMVKVTDSWPAYHECEPSTTEDTPCREAMDAKSVDSKTSSLWCGVVVRKGGASSGVVLLT
ncbi:hypothetical protein TNCV_1779451 [Trichonephila clavipes]|nr:hypothetical protein TNCV_1779451 [Trichonephila clavipes]